MGEQKDQPRGTLTGCIPAPTVRMRSMKTLSSSIVVLSSAMVFHAAAVSEIGDGRTVLFAVGFVIAFLGLAGWRAAMQAPSSP